MTQRKLIPVSLVAAAILTAFPAFATSEATRAQLLADAPAESNTQPHKHHAHSKGYHKHEKGHHKGHLDRQDQKQRRESER